MPQLNPKMLLAAAVLATVFPSFAVAQTVTPTPSAAAAAAGTGSAAVKI